MEKKSFGGHVFKIIKKSVNLFVLINIQPLYLNVHLYFSSVCKF